MNTIETLDFNIVESKLRKIYQEFSNINFTEKNISIDDTFDKFGINSVDFIKIIVGIESEFNFEFYDDDLQMDRFTNMRSLIEYILERTSSKE